MSFKKSFYLVSIAYAMCLSPAIWAMGDVLVKLTAPPLKTDELCIEDLPLELIQIIFTFLIDVDGQNKKQALKDIISFLRTKKAYTRFLNDPVFVAWLFKIILGSNSSNTDVIEIGVQIGTKTAAQYYADMIKRNRLLKKENESYLFELANTTYQSEQDQEVAARKVKFLLKAQTSPYLKFNNKVSPLMAAVTLNPLIVKAMLECNLLLNINCNKMALREACTHSNNMQTIKMLIEHGIDVDAQTNRFCSETALHWAVFRGQADYVKILLDAEADPNIQDVFGHTPIMKAAMRGDEEMVERLRSYGAKSSIVCNSRNTASELAARSGYSELAKKLAKYENLEKEEVEKTQ